MNYQTITITTRDFITILTINRPQALNALNQQVMGELHHFFLQTEHDFHQMRGVLITGAENKAFVAGADIKEFESLDKETATELSAFGHGIFDCIEQFPVPVLAAINGFALGGGCELAMACHIRIASDNARFGQPEVSLGILPGYGGTQRLPALIGKGRALHMLLTGELIDAIRALEYGLITQVVNPAELLESGIKILKTILAKGPLAIEKTIQAVNAGYNPEDDGYAVEIEAFGQLAATEDFKEGVRAFIGKRKAEFKGK